MEEEGAFQADAKALQLSVCFQGVERTMYFDLEDKEEWMCVIKLSVPSLVISQAAFLVWLSFTLYSFKESTDEFHYPVAGTMLGMDTTVSMSTDSGPKDVIGKEKRMPGCYGVTEGKLSSLP